MVRDAGGGEGDAELAHWEARYEALAKQFRAATFVAVDLEDVKAWKEFTGILFQPPNFLPYVQLFRAGGAVVPKWKGSSVTAEELREALAGLGVQAPRRHLLAVQSSLQLAVPRVPAVPSALGAFRLSRVKGFLVRSAGSGPSASDDRGRAIRSGGWSAVAAAVRSTSTRAEAWTRDLLRVPTHGRMSKDEAMPVLSTRGQSRSVAGSAADPDTPLHELARRRRGSLAAAEVELSSEMTQMAMRTRSGSHMRRSLIGGPTPAAGSSRMLNELSATLSTKSMI